MPYDRFQNRVMFPIHDRGGRVVAFGGRALDPEAKAKYLNSPETELFHKGSLLLQPSPRAQGRRTIAGEIIAVEGYVDVIAMTQGGISADGGAARHGADGRSMRAAVDDGRRSRSSASTATRRAARPRFARSRRRCR